MKSWKAKLAICGIAFMIIIFNSLTTSIFAFSSSDADTQLESILQSAGLQQIEGTSFLYDETTHEVYVLIHQNSKTYNIVPLYSDRGHVYQYTDGQIVEVVDVSTSEVIFKQ